MKIESKRMVKPLAEIRQGECFEFEEDFFIRTDEITERGLSVCVNIQCGTLYRLDEEYMVMPVNAKVVIE